MAVVWIPSLLRPLTSGHKQVTVSGATVGEIIAALDRQYPGIRARISDGDRLQPGIAIAIDGVVGTLGLRQPVGTDSEVHITPAISGGGKAYPLQPSGETNMAIDYTCGV